MAKNKVRHLPVMEGEEIIGMVSMRDLINPLYYNPFCHSRSVQSGGPKQ
jgi:signal-transduction protein with cAMP-binding, CBS, and nucleotidyltransferase domain